MADSFGYTKWQYDQRGRALSEVRGIPGLGEFKTEYMYNPDDSVAIVIYPTGEWVYQTYDATGREQKVAGANEYLNDATYTASGQPDLLTFGNGVTTDYAYYDDAYYQQNPADDRVDSTRLRSIWTGNPTSGQGVYWSYDYDKVGNITAWWRPGYATPTGFGYDARNRFTSVNGETKYQYDKLGNITAFNGKTYGYDPLHKHAVKTVNGAEAMRYDQNGNMIWRNMAITSTSGGIEPTTGIQTLAYDEENRVKEIDTAGQKTQIYYDGDGNRVLEVLPDGGKIAYIGKHLEVFQPKPTPPTLNCTVSRCIYLPIVMSRTSTTMTPYNFTGAYWKTFYNAVGQTIAVRHSTGQVTFLHNDHLGSVVGTSNYALGAIPTVVNTYNAWGAQTNTGQPSVGSGNFTAITRNYTGQDSVPNTGLLYYNARYYLPSVGRFISPDTIVPDYTDPQYLNRYSYVRNNPIRYNDPTGHCEVVCFLGIVAVVLIAALSNPGTAYAPAPGAATPPMPIPCDFCVALDSISGTGDVSDIWALLSGHRLFTGEEQDRRVALAFAVLPIAAGGLAARSGKSADEMAEIAEGSVRSEARIFKSFTSSNFRHNLGQLTGNIPINSQAHHVFPQKYMNSFSKAGINIHDPKFGVWWESTSHLQNANAYNAGWDKFWRNNHNPSQSEILTFGRNLMKNVLVTKSIINGKIRA